MKNLLNPATFASRCGTNWITEHRHAVRMQLGLGCGALGVTSQKDLIFQKQATVREV